MKTPYPSKHSNVYGAELSRRGFLLPVGRWWLVLVC